MIDSYSNLHVWFSSVFVVIVILTMTTTCKRRKVDRGKAFSLWSNDCLHEYPILRPNQKIFLSHSGAQKEFVEQLSVDLERHHRFAFFDKRPSSLPKGERFPNLIKDAVKQCEMMVVVVSDEYFTSKWPMIKLHTFMQASVEHQKMKILPLFFGLHVEEVSETRNRKRWFKVWARLAMADVQGRINVKEWEQCLNLILTYNGLRYDRQSEGVVAYRQNIVSHICKAIPPDVKFDESHVQGRKKLCEVVREHFQNTPDSTERPNVRVIGLYGVSGIGKTQLCKIMCNELDGEFDGKVCHMELSKQIEDHAVVKKVLIALTNVSVEVVQEVEKDKCESVLFNKSNWKQKTFISIDNVWDDIKSLEQAKLVLQAPFVKGSWVIVTSQFKKTLKQLDIDENACFEMPKLDEDDAKNLFLYHATDRKKSESKEDTDAIEECIRSCYFWDGKSQGSQSHPLSLKALGVYLQYHGGGRPSDWMKKIAKHKESSYLRDPENPVFTNLGINFDGLPQWEQDLFMEMALFSSEGQDLMEWLSVVHNGHVIQDGVQHLVDKGLLEGVDWSSNRVSMHDLYREFATLASKANILNLEKRRIYVDCGSLKVLEDEPRSFGMRLTRLWLVTSPRLRQPIMDLERIDWTHFTQLVTLELHICFTKATALNLKKLVSLRSLILYTPHMGSQMDFTKFVGNDLVEVGQLPASLEFVVVRSAWNCSEILLRRNFLHLCAKLMILDLNDVIASSLDFRNCKSLQKVYLCKVRKLKYLKGFAVGLGSRLQSLSILHCNQLVKIDGLGSLVRLRSLQLMGNSSLSELGGLSGLKGLKCLILGNCRSILELPSLTGLESLCSLSISDLCIIEMPNLSGLNQLESIRAKDCRHLSRLQGLGDLPALKVLDLGLDSPGQWQPCQLPSSMSKLTSLQQLNLCNRGVEFHEEDVRTLQGLQLLEPVLVNCFNTMALYYLDFRRLKILFCTSEMYAPDEGNVCQTLRRYGWEEKDLRVPTGYLVGEGFKIRDVIKNWNLDPGPTVKNRGNRLEG